MLSQIQSVLTSYYILIFKMNDKVFKEVANNLGLKESDVKDVYRLTLQFIKDKIEELPLKEDLTEEEFNKLKTAFILPEIGKFGCDYNTYKKIRFWYLKRGKSNDKND